MQFFKRVGFLHYGALVTLVLGTTLTVNLLHGDKAIFLPGSSTKGHHQIEQQCDVCHVQAFDTEESMQNACLGCHAEALDAARDTHPMKKFTDPRNAELLASLDATRCVTCHIEHSPEVTGKFGVTLPQDFCFYCHQNIAEDRPSHAGFDYATCADSGCHNFHDNKALYETFLAKHLRQPPVLKKAQVHVPNAVALWHKKNPDSKPLSATQSDGGSLRSDDEHIVMQWQDSAHAVAQVNCSDCHHDVNQADVSVAEDAYALTVTACEACHERQATDFQSGLHGMRLAEGLPAMQPGQARLPMHVEESHATLTCASCHDPHQPDLTRAAVDACLSCHADEHSKRYSESKHAELWRREQAGDLAPGSGVSCATCHMPRIKKGKLVYVEHNQSATLEPNSKMLRPVCLECHGLEYAMAALADRNLIRRNFSGSFDPNHPSFKLVRDRVDAKRARRQRAKKTTSTTQ